MRRGFGSYSAVFGDCESRQRLTRPCDRLAPRSHWRRRTSPKACIVGGQRGGLLSNRTRLGAGLALPVLSRSRRPYRARRWSRNGRAGGGMETRECNRAARPSVGVSTPQAARPLAAQHKPPSLPSPAIIGSIVRPDDARSPRRQHALFVHKSRIPRPHAFSSHFSGPTHIHDAARTFRRPGLCAPRLRQASGQVQAARARPARSRVGAAGRRGACSNDRYRHHTLLAPYQSATSCALFG